MELLDLLRTWKKETITTVALARNLNYRFKFSKLSMKIPFPHKIPRSRVNLIGSTLQRWCWWQRGGGAASCCKFCQLIVVCFFNLRVTVEFFILITKLELELSWYHTTFFALDNDLFTI